MEEAWGFYTEVQLRCPWCSRTGRNLRYHDELKYAICCSDENNCTSKLQRANNPVRSKASYIGETLDWALNLPQPHQLDQPLKQIGRFLVGGEEQEWSECSDKEPFQAKKAWPTPLDQPGRIIHGMGGQTNPSWKCRWCAGDIPPMGKGRDRVVYNWCSDFIGLNTPFAVGQYCRVECQANMDHDLRQQLSGERALGYTLVIDSMRAWAVTRPPVPPTSFRRDQQWLHRRIEDAIDASETLTKGEAREEFRAFREEIHYWNELAYRLGLLKYSPSRDLSEEASAVSAVLEGLLASREREMARGRLTIVRSTSIIFVLPHKRRRGRNLKSTTGPTTWSRLHRHTVLLVPYVRSGYSQIVVGGTRLGGPPSDCVADGVQCAYFLLFIIGFDFLIGNVAHRLRSQKIPLYSIHHRPTELLICFIYLRDFLNTIRARSLDW